MSTQSHLEILRHRHADLEQQLHRAQNHPGIDSLQIGEIKRRKLALKDEIDRLKKVSGARDAV